LKQVKELIFSCFPFSSNVGAEFMCQADNRREHIDYDGGKAKIIAAHCNDAMADLDSCNDCLMIAIISINPETMAIDKDIKRRF
jgi:hypothetical protein